MPNEFSIRRFAIDEWRTYRDLRLAALADSPEAFGSSHAAESQRADSEWRHRLASTEGAVANIALVAVAQGATIGLVWGKIWDAEPEVVRVYQMWVTPQWRSRGAGRALLDAVIAWAVERNVEQVRLGVTLGDTPAVRLYQRAGFVPVGEARVIREEPRLEGQELVLDLGALRRR